MDMSSADMSSVEVWGSEVLLKAAVQEGGPSCSCRRCSCLGDMPSKHKHCNYGMGRGTYLGVHK